MKILRRAGNEGVKRQAPCEARPAHNPPPAISVRGLPLEWRHPLLHPPTFPLFAVGGATVWRFKFGPNARVVYRLFISRSMSYKLRTPLALSRSALVWSCKHQQNRNLCLFWTTRYIATPARYDNPLRNQRYTMIPLAMRRFDFTLYVTFVKLSIREKSLLEIILTIDVDSDLGLEEIEGILKMGDGRV